jgi:integrase
MREGLLTKNVAALAGSPAIRQEIREPLTADQAKALLMTLAGTPDRAVTVATALFTGMRPGERLGLTRDAIDLQRGIITVSWQLQRVTWGHGCGGSCGRVRGADCPQRVAPIRPNLDAEHVTGGLWLIRPKSRRGWREVPICAPLAEMLAQWVDTRPPGPHGLVFTGPDGRPIDPAADSKAWRADLAAAGLPPIELYSLRHTTATLLAELEMPEQQRMQILGHSTATVTRGYTHVTSATSAATMERLGELLAP